MKKKKKILFIIGGIVFLGVVALITILISSNNEKALSKVSIDGVMYPLKSYYQRFQMQLLEDFVSLNEEEYEHYTVGGILPSSLFQLKDAPLYLSVHLSDEFLGDSEEALENYKSKFIEQEDREIRASGILKQHRHFILHMELFDELENTILHLVIFSSDKKLTMVGIKVPDDKNMMYQEAIQGMLNSITVK